VLDSLFNSAPNVLEDILGDQVHGINMIQKVLASQYIDPPQKQVFAEKVKAVLLSLRVQVRYGARL
jgi:protein JSN1